MDANTAFAGTIASTAITAAGVRMDRLRKMQKLLLNIILTMQATNILG
jgi:hypothetical protein